MPFLQTNPNLTPNGRALLLHAFGQPTDPNALKDAMRHHSVLYGRIDDILTELYRKMSFSCTVLAKEGQPIRLSYDTTNPSEAKRQLKEVDRLLITHVQ